MFTLLYFCGYTISCGGGMVMEFDMEPALSPTYLVNWPRSNASDIQLKAETKAAIIAFTLKCSYQRSGNIDFIVQIPILFNQPRR